MNYNQAYNLCLALQALETTDESIPIKTGFIIVQNKTALQTAVQPFDEMRTNIIKKYADGETQISSSNPNFEKCLNEINEIGSQNCEVELKKIKIDDLGELKLPMNVLTALSEMIIEE